MKLDPRLAQYLRELYGDRNVTEDDHDLVVKMLQANEITGYMLGRGRLCYNGVWAPYSRNKLLQNGPKIVIRRVWNVATVPSVPSIIRLGTGTSAYNRSFAGCETEISDAGLVFGAADTVVVGTADANYGDDKVTITKDFGTLTLTSGPYDVSEMALRNTDGTPLNFNRFIVSTKQISTGGTLQAEVVVQHVA